MQLRHGSFDCHRQRLILANKYIFFCTILTIPFNFNVAVKKSYGGIHRIAAFTEYQLVKVIGVDADLPAKRLPKTNY